MAIRRLSGSARLIVFASAATLMFPAVAIGQTGSPSPPPGSDTTPVLFAVAPTDPTDRTLTLLVDKADCGTRWQDAVATAEVSESPDVIAVRVEVRLGPVGQLCTREDLVRVQVELDEPVGTRAITDAATGRPALVNQVDAEDLGYQYACSSGTGRPFSVSQILGPGDDITSLGVSSEMDGARAMVDEGDLVVLRGPFDERGRVDIETWRLRGDSWLSRSERCRLMAVYTESLYPATWRLKGPRPGASAKTLDIWVDEQWCASGNSPKGRIVPPDIHVTRDALTMLVRVFPITRTWEANEASADGFAYVDCQGAPPAPYTVKLFRRLADRVLYDAAYFPPNEIKGRRR